MCNALLLKSNVNSHYFYITMSLLPFMNILTGTVYSFCMKPELSFIVSSCLFCYMGKLIIYDHFLVLVHI